MNRTGEHPTRPQNPMLVCLPWLVACCTLPLPASGAGLVAVEAPAPAIKAVLLLHGMNSNPTDAWGPFVQRHFGGHCATVFDGDVVEGQATPNGKNVVCYRVRFGAFDSNRAGLQGISSTEPSGDFSTHDELGAEVASSVRVILTQSAAAEIVLIGHSRGGLAARAFLQSDQYPTEKDHVIGLLTIGSPHRGSPFGRIYDYLDQHPELTCRGITLHELPCANDWDIVEGLWGSGLLDLRRPVIGFLSDQSDEIANLNGNIGNLKQGGVAYGQIRYRTVDFGVVSLTVKNVRKLFSFITGPFIRLTNARDIRGTSQDISAREFVLGAAKPSAYRGDGIVSFASQSYLTLPGFPSNQTTFDFRYTTPAPAPVHTEELNKKWLPNINKALRKMLQTWWTAAQ